MTLVNPYAAPGFTVDQSASTCIDWEDWQIEIRGAALANRLWGIIQYTITIDANETFSSAQLTGTEEFRWRFKHRGRDADARFEPIEWQRHGRQKFRIRIGRSTGVPAEKWRFGKAKIKANPGRRNVM